MIKTYINKFIENLPEHITNTNKPIEIDLILGGGAFNGSYILGALYFLREMERKGYIIVKRISSCSVSTVLALLYLTDNLDKVDKFYFDVVENFKRKGNFSILLSFKERIKEYVTEKSLETINKRLYISYNNVACLKKRVACKYNNIDDLFESIIRSCFIPFFIDFKTCYRNKYIDGVTPFFFEPTKNKRKRIFIDVYTLDKLIYSVNIKNEKNYYHRLFEGMLDIHLFFIKGHNTSMCSDIDNWYLYNYTKYYIYIMFEKFVVLLICLICKIKVLLLSKNKCNYLRHNIGNLIKHLVVNNFV